MLCCLFPLSCLVAARRTKSEGDAGTQFAIFYTWKVWEEEGKWRNSGNYARVMNSTVTKPSMIAMDVVFGWTLTIISILLKPLRYV